MAVSASVKSNSVLIVDEYRYLELTAEEILYDIPGNYSIVRCTLAAKGDVQRYTDVSPIDASVNGTSIYKSTSVQLWESDPSFPCAAGSVSKDLTIYHDSDGKKKIKLVLTGMVYYHEAKNTSAAWLTLTDIPRASEISASDTVLGESCTISLDRKVASYTHTVSWAIGNESGTLATKSSAVKFSWTPAESLAAQFPASPTGTCTITAVTYSGNTVIGTKTKTINLIPPSTMVPTVVGLLAERVDGVVPSDWGIYVQNKSKVQLTVEDAQGVYGSEIVKYEITGDGSSWQGNSVTTGFISGNGNITYKCTVTDSRGRTGSAEVSIYVEAYSPPSISFSTTYRCDEDGAAVDDGKWLYGRAQASFSQIGSNAVTLILGLYSATGSLIEEDQMQSGTACVIGGSMSGQYNYRAVITAADSLGETTEVSEVIPSENVAFTMRPGGTGAAFGKYANREKALEFPEDWDIYFGDSKLERCWLDIVYPVGSIYLSVSSSFSPGTVFGGTWEKLENRFLLGAGSSYTIGATGGAATVTLTTDQMPSHRHGWKGVISKREGVVDESVVLPAIEDDNTNLANYWASDGSNGPQAAGGGKAHNNMPPYLVVNMWKRTA